MKFKQWLNTLVDEKGYDREMIIEVEGNSGTNHIPLQALIETIENCPKHEQVKIRDKLVFIDFRNGDCLDYFKHLAKAIAI